MVAPGVALFDTPIGRCGMAWSTEGIVAVQLPGADDDTTRARLASYVRGAVAGDDLGAAPPEVMDAIGRIVGVLNGARDDLGSVVVDLRGVDEFSQLVYEQARRIAPGETRTYGQLAAAIGRPGAARAVGGALGRNPCPIVVPCHRVVAAGGRAGGFSAPGGVHTKLRMLAIEGAVIPALREPALFDEPRSGPA